MTASLLTAMPEVALCPETGGGCDVACGAVTREARGSPSTTLACRDGIALTLEAARDERRGGRLSHLGIVVDQPDLDELRRHAAGLGCRIITDRDHLLVLDDTYGVRWEVSTTGELASTGARTGRWLDVPP